MDSTRSGFHFVTRVTCFELVMVQSEKGPLLRVAIANVHPLVCGTSCLLEGCGKPHTMSNILVVQRLHIAVLLGYLCGVVERLEQHWVFVKALSIDCISYACPLS